MKATLRYILAALAVLTVALVVGCGSSGNSSPNPNSTTTSAYQAGYTFGSTGAQNNFNNSSGEAADLNNNSGPNPCTEIATGGPIPASYDVPASENPPSDAAGQQQWNNGCYAGIDAVTGDTYPTNNGG